MKYLVITKVGKETLYDDFVKEVKEGRGRKRLVHVRLPVFKFGEILIMDKDGELGRDISGRRAPRKWEIEYKVFTNIKKACLYSLNI